MGIEESLQGLRETIKELEEMTAPSAPILTFYADKELITAIIAESVKAGVFLTVIGEDRNDYVIALRGNEKECQEIAFAYLGEMK